MSSFEGIKIQMIARIDAVSEFSAENEGEREEICKAIANEIKKDITNQVELGEEKILFFVVSNLSPDSRISLIEAALWAWIRLCRQEVLNKSTMNVNNCDLSSNYLEKLVSILDTHFHHSIIAYLCSILIMVLASDSEERQQGLGKAGAPKAVVQVLKAHRENPDVLEFACRAARNLSADDEVASMLVQEAIGEELNILLTQHSYPVEVTEAIIFVVINLSYDLDIAKILGSLGCTAAIVEMIPNFMHNGGLINRMLWALRNLTSTSNNVSILVSSNIVTLLLQIATIHREDPDTMQSLVWTISNLVASTELGKQFLNHSFLSTLIELNQFGLENYQEDMTFGPIAEAIVFTIYNLIAGIEKHRDAPINPENPPSEESIQQLNNEIHSIKVRLGEIGACQLISFYLERFAIREAMVEACCRTILRLSTRCPENRILLANFQVMSKLLNAQDRNEEILETVFLIWQAMLCLLNNTDSQGKYIDNNQNNLNLTQFQDLSTQIVHSTNKIMKSFIEYEEIGLFGCQLLIYSGYYSLEKLRELQEIGYLNEFLLLTKDANMIKLKEKLGLLSYQQDGQGEANNNGEDQNDRRRLSE